MICTTKKYLPLCLASWMHKQYIFTQCICYSFNLKTMYLLKCLSQKKYSNNGPKKTLNTLKSMGVSHFGKIPKYLLQSASVKSKVHPMCGPCIPKRWAFHQCSSSQVQRVRRSKSLKLINKDISELEGSLQVSD